VLTNNSLSLHRANQAHAVRRVFAQERLTQTITLQTSQPRVYMYIHP